MLDLNLGEHNVIHYFFKDFSKDDVPERIGIWPGVKADVFKYSKYGGEWMGSHEYGEC